MEQRVIVSDGWMVPPVAGRTEGEKEGPNERRMQGREATDEG